MPGMSSNKTIAKNSLILYFRLIVVSLLGMVATRYVLKYLGVSDFGLYSVVGSVVVMMNFFNTVMIATTYRYVAFEMGRDGGKNVNKVFNISLIIHLAMILVVVALSETIGMWYIRNKLTLDAGRLDDAIFVFRMSVLAAVFNILSIPYQGLITALEKFSVRASIEILRAVLNISLVLLLGLFVAEALRVYAIMMTGLAFFSSILFITYCRIYYSKFVQLKMQYERVKYKEMIAFSGWTMIGAAAQVGKDTGSQLIINVFFGTILNAAFGIANRLNSFVKFFASNLGQAAIPQITKSYSGGDHDRTKQLVTYISKYSFFLMYLPALPLILETRFVLKLWLGEVPEYSVEFCRLMLFNGLIDSFMAGVPAAAQASGRIKWFQLSMSVIMLLSLLVSYWLFKLGLPPFSIIIAYISSSAMNVFVSIYLLKRILNFDVHYLIFNSYLKIIFVFLATLPLYYISRLMETSLMTFILISISSVIWLLVVIYKLGLEQKEKEVIFSYLLVKLRKIKPGRE